MLGMSIASVDQKAMLARNSVSTVASLPPTQFQMLRPWVCAITSSV